MKQLGFFIIFSIIFHFLVSTSTLYIAEKLKSTKKTQDLTQIEILDQKQDSIEEKLEKTKQLIKQLKTNVAKIPDLKKATRFESEKTQRVLKETKAAKLGVSQNSEKTIPAPRVLKQSPTQPTQSENQKHSVEKGDQPEFTKATPNMPQSTAMKSSSISSTLPSDIENSNATNLNTDAGTYYSFYSRVEDLFYVRWVERVHYYWERTSPDYKKNVLAGKIWSTTLEIWLTSNGEFHSAYIKQPSGFKAFDEAAVFSFKDARFFPNPPKAKVESDGFVRLRYRFNVRVDAY